MPTAHRIAQWISHPADEIQHRPNTWLRFRRSIELAKLPAEAVCEIAVDSKYWLWINGRLIVREGALKRGPTSTGTYVDRLDLRPHLLAGNNLISLLAWYWGAGGSSHHSSGRAGLWLSAPSIGLTSDASWRVTEHPGYRPSEAKLFNGQQIVPEWSVVYDASRCPSPEDWTRNDFNAANWPAAVEIGLPPCAPWSELHPRPIPFFRDGELTAYESQTVEDTGTGRTIRAHLLANLQLYPAFTITARAGQTVTIQIERDWKTTTYLTRDGRQAFEVPAWGNGHWVDYHFPPGVEVHDLSYRPTSYDTDIVGRFECDDADLNTLWTKSARSTVLNLRDSYMDCPDRERSQWPSDASYIAAQTYPMLDTRAHALTKKFLREFIQWRSPDGVLWGAVPTGRFTPESFREFVGQSLMAIAFGAGDYFRETGDAETITELYPAFCDYLLDHFHLDANGLVAARGPAGLAWGPGTQTWFDWGEHQDHRLLENTLYFLSLRAAAAFAREAHPEINSHLDSIVASFHRVFWNGHAYRSAEHTGEIDDRGNALAVLVGLAPSSAFTSLVDVLTSQHHASIAAERYPLAALCQLGRPELAIERMKRRYRREIDSPYSTLPEHWGEQSNHGWGGGPLVILARYIAGVEATTPGYATWQLRPQIASLTHVRADIATTCGVVSIEISRAANTCTIDILACPAGGEIEIGPTLFSGFDLPAATLQSPTGTLPATGKPWRQPIPAGKSRWVVQAI